MTDTATTPDAAAQSDGADDNDAAVIERMLELVCDDPPILLAMARALAGVVAMLDLVSAASRHDPGNELIAGLQEVAASVGLIHARQPEDEELLDPEWWGHAAGIEAGELLVEIPDDIVDAVEEMRAALGLGETGHAGLEQGA